MNENIKLNNTANNNNRTPARIQWRPTTSIYSSKEEQEREEKKLNDDQLQQPHNIQLLTSAFWPSWRLDLLDRRSDVSKVGQWSSFEAVDANPDVILTLESRRPRATHNTGRSLVHFWKGKSGKKIVQRWVSHAV